MDSRFRFHFDSKVDHGKTVYIIRMHGIGVKKVHL